MAITFKRLNNNIFITSSTRTKDDEYDGFVNLNACNFIKTHTNVTSYIGYNGITYNNVSLMRFVTGNEEFVWIYNNLQLLIDDYDTINLFLKDVTKYAE